MRKLKNVLVTGGAGFIGSNFIHYLFGKSTSGEKAFEDANFSGRIINVEKFPGKDLGSKIEKTALAIYKKCYEHALKNGIIIADTKFEFGLDENGELVLGDEVLTPDSSRFWNAGTYKVGTSPASYDKQFIRDWLKENNLAGDPTIKSVPAEVVAETSKLYHECVKKITGKDL